jgi:tetratricopeptide (TPR) repeat protein
MPTCCSPANRPAEALAQYRTALKFSPNRFNGMYNAGRAAEAAGKPAEAIDFYEQLMKVTNSGARSQRPEVAYARKFVQKNSEKNAAGL